MKIAVTFVILLHLTKVLCQNEFDFAEMAVTMSKELRITFEKYVEGNADINAECQADLLIVLNGLEQGEMWALRMLDASAKTSSGILEGNTQNLGFFDECIGINEKIGSRNMLGQYCLVRNVKPSVIFQKKLQISRAVCLPSTCSINDIGAFLKQFNVSAVLSNESCQTQNSFPVDTKSWTILAFFGSILFLMVASTVYDVVITHIYKENGSALLGAFSIFKNGKIIFTVVQYTTEIGCVNGIRGLSVIWLIVMQMHLHWRHYVILNQTETLQHMVEHKYDFILGVSKVVDTFLLLSGLMVTHAFLSEKFDFNLFNFYARRYFRLTPALGAVVLAQIGLVQFLNSGPNWLANFSELRNECINYWWKTIFYVDNVGYSKCVFQSWCLSVDMQLYILSPVILLSLRKKPKLGLCLTVFLILCVMVINFAITWIYELPVNFFHDTKFRLYIGTYYMQTYTRAAPWFIGVIVGYIIHKTKQSKEQNAMKPLFVTLMWALSLLILTVCSLFEFHTNDEDLKIKLRNCFYNAFARVLWPAAVAWVIFACHFGYGGFVNDFLSSPIFQVLSRLSYCNYLTHMLVLNAYESRMRSPIYFSHADNLLVFCGIFVYTQLASVVLTLGFELPVMVFEKVLFVQKPCARKSVEMA